MRITKRFKALCQRAQEDGIRNVVSIVGAYKATTYCDFYPIERILAAPEGTSWRRHLRWDGRWEGHSNTRQMDEKEDIGYQELFKVYG